MNEWGGWGPDHISITATGGKVTAIYFDAKTADGKKRTKTFTSDEVVTHGNVSVQSVEIKRIS